MNLRFQDLPPAVRHLWAKSGERHGHSLVCHMLDVAAVAEIILCREPPQIRDWTGNCFGLGAKHVSRWCATMVGLHDLGKSIPGFQDKWPEGRLKVEASGLDFPARLLDKNRHDLATVELFKHLIRADVDSTAWAGPIARALGAHHGFFSSIAQCKAATPTFESLEWIGARQGLFKAYWETLNPESPNNFEVDLPAMVWMAGLASVADWIGSNTDWFPLGERSDTLTGHLLAAQKLAERALDEIGWPTWAPLLKSEASTTELICAMLGTKGIVARPLQVVADQLLQQAQGPILMLVEAPMGEGKTELAFLAHLRLQARNQHRGMYVALPTQATGNAMFNRTLTFLEAFAPSSGLDIQLVHGGAAIDDRIQRLRQIGGTDTTDAESVASSAWFSARKRPLLSPYGVGTIDQALIAGLNVKHHFVRLWGLTNRVVVLDEVHAYDTYTGSLVEALVRWLRQLGCSVVLMSATLPEKRREALLGAWGSGNAPDLPYPRILMATGDQVLGSHVECRNLEPIRVEGLPEDLETLAESAMDSLSGGGCGAIILNTVKRTQAMYVYLKTRLGPDVRLILFHARFPADQRSALEKEVLEVFGQGDQAGRPARALLVASQVAEQSLDIDFDFLLSDLAPIDLLLQRAGRLHRHQRTRPSAHTQPLLMVAGLRTDQVPELKQTGWGYVYDKYILLRTWGIASREPLWQLPGDIDRLVQAVYSGDPFEGEDAYLDILDHARGEHLAQTKMASQLAKNAAIEADGEPLDAYNQLQLSEEDEGRNRLLAATRLGEESCAVVPMLVSSEGWHLFPDEPPFDPQKPINDDLARRIYGRQVRLGRQGLVQALLAMPLPEGFQKHPLLQHLYPIGFENGQANVNGFRIGLDSEMGITYPPKEKA